MKQILLVIVLFAVSELLSAQRYVSHQADSLVKGSSQVHLNPVSKNPEFIKYKALQFVGGSPMDKARFLKQNLALPVAYEFRPRQESIAKSGSVHTRHQLYLHGFPVEGMVFITHVKDNQLVSANGKLIRQEVKFVLPVIGREDALMQARRVIKSKAFRSDVDVKYDEGGDLVYVMQDSVAVLCYKFDIYSLEPLQREYVFISAENGEVIKRMSRIHDNDVVGTAETLYSGIKSITTDSYNNIYRLRESARGNGIATYDCNNATFYSYASDFEDDDNYWDNVDDKVANDAHFGTEATYDFYYEKYGRNSIDDNGFELRSYVHYGDNYANAFWDGEKMTYGDGDGVRYLPLTSLDIVAHEITHGLTSFSAALQYSYESGALNESFSDIFGVAVDFYANPGSANYLIGEQVRTNGIPFRSMADPNSLGYPDTYQGNYWYTGSGDHGGVHTNSSVQNYWFYLLCEGDEGVNDVGDAYHVVAIGIDDAAAIAYHNLTAYLTPTSNFEDARNYSIQAAIDLFGNCSQQVVSVTDAWHAVGVGERFTSSVVAGFYASQYYSCEPSVSISFFNTSENATSYEWFVNEERTSEEANPVLDFDATGIYDITLVAHGNTLCNMSDTLAMASSVEITDDGRPLLPASQPATLAPGLSGIVSFLFAGIDNQTGGAIEGYQDYTCEFKGDVLEGKSYPFKIITEGQLPAKVYVWLDCNNDGAFNDDNERLFLSPAGTGEFEGAVIIPASVHNVPLRLRIGADDAAFKLRAGATQPRKGQYEDYTVYVQHNEDKPAAFFDADRLTVGTGEIIRFSDRSENMPAEWSWSFEGGMPASSDIQHPEVSYNQTGVYDVRLIAVNEYGSDTLIKADYISVSNEYILDRSQVSNRLSGTLYDSGGPAGNYSNKEDYTFLIEPVCASSVDVTFEVIATESCCDYLYIYDGTTVNDPLLATLRGTMASTSFTATSGTALIHFYSDASVTQAGFKITWESEIGTGGAAVDAVFEVEEENPALNVPVQFINLTANALDRWEWQFGDGHYSTQKSPEHAYGQAGNHTVWMKAFGCHNQDSLSHDILVQQAPLLDVSVDTLFFELSATEELDYRIPVGNQGLGDLVYAMQVENKIASLTGVTAQPGVLPNQVFQPEGDQLVGYFKGEYINDGEALAYDYTRVISFGGDYRGLNFLFLSYKYTVLEAELQARGANVFNEADVYDAALLDTMDIVMLDDRYILYPNNKEALRLWCEAGGKIILQGDSNFDTFNSLLSGTAIRYQNSQIREGLTSRIYEESATYGMKSYYIGNAVASLIIDNEDNYLIDDEAGTHYAALAKVGEGSMLVLTNEAFDNYHYGLEGHAVLFNNFIDYSASWSPDAWLRVDETPGTIAPGSNTEVLLTVDAINRIAGTYVADVVIQSNDAGTEEAVLPVKLLVTGVPDINVTIDSLWFEKVFVGEADSLEVTVWNEGTDVLAFTSVVASNADIIMVAESNTILPRSQKSFLVRFAPTQSRQYREILTFNSNDPDEPAFVLQVVGNAVVAPVIAANPVTLSADLYTSERVHDDLVISNVQGGSELIFSEISVDNFESLPGNGVNYDTINVSLTGLEVAFIDQNYSSLYSYLLQQGATVRRTNLDNPAIAQSDIVILSDATNLSSNQVGMLRSRVESGKALWMDIDAFTSYHNQLLAGTGIQFVQANAGGAMAMTQLADHQTTRNIGNYQVVESNTSLVVTGEMATPVITKNNGDIYAVVAQMGAGRILAVSEGSLASPYAAGHFQLFRNSIRWLGPKNNWVWLNQFPSDTIEAGATQDLHFMLDANGLGSGEYKCEISIITNDPETPELRIPVQLNVTGTGVPEVFNDTLDFETAYVGYPKLDSMKVMNNGTEDLVISGVTFDDSRFSSSLTSLVIQPREVKTIPVEFTGTEEGAVKAGMLLHTNSAVRNVIDVVLAANVVVAPVAAVDPSQMSVTLLTHQTGNLPLTISNLNGGSRLSYALQVTNCDEGDDSMDNLPLQAVLDSLNGCYQEITELIPARYDFTEGVVGNNIIDGGFDMYDGGNLLTTNLMAATFLSYSDNTVISNDALGANGQYFTRKVPGLFVLVADINNMESFSIEGDLGADGNGVVDGTVLQVENGAHLYSGFVKRVFNAEDPSVNHLIVVESQLGITHGFVNNTNYDDHMVSGLSSARRLYYLLFASQDGGYINDEVMRSIMNRFITFLNAEKPEWVAVSAAEGTVETGQSDQVDVVFDPSEMAAGTYYACLQLLSNDPENNTITVGLEMDVIENQPPVIVQPIGDRITHITSSDSIGLNYYFSDPDDDQLLFTVEASDETVVFPTVSAGGFLYFNAAAMGVSNITVTATDNNYPAIQQSFSVQVRDNNIPLVIQNIQDQEMDIADLPLVFRYSDYFSDPDEDAMVFDATVVQSQLVTLETGAQQVQITPVAPGTTIVTLLATDEKSPAVTLEFMLTITGVADLLDAASRDGKPEIYPNPVTVKFYLGKGSGETIIKVSVYNIEGVLVKAFNGDAGGASGYNVAELSSGVYLVVVNTSTQVYIYRLMIGD